MSNQAHALKEIRKIRGTSPALTQAAKLSAAFTLITAGTTAIVQLSAQLLVKLIA